jgi:hypothetical protein
MHPIVPNTVVQQVHEVSGENLRENGEENASENNIEQSTQDDETGTESDDDLEEHSSAFTAPEEDPTQN